MSAHIHVSIVHAWIYYIVYNYAVECYCTLGIMKVWDFMCKSIAKNQFMAAMVRQKPFHFKSKKIRTEFSIY